MTHTTEQLKVMTDTEINKALADLLKVKWQISAVDDECLMVGSDVLDYCNNPSDIMPLIAKSGIDVEFGESKTIAATNLCALYEFGECDHWFEDENPYRAIACLLLLIGE